jgi:hypothetical protein
MESIVFQCYLSQRWQKFEKHHFSKKVEGDMIQACPQKLNKLLNVMFFDVGLLSLDVSLSMTSTFFIFYFLPLSFDCSSIPEIYSAELIIFEAPQFLRFLGRSAFEHLFLHVKWVSVESNSHSCCFSDVYSLGLEQITLRILSLMSLDALWVILLFYMINSNKNLNRRLSMERE